MALTCLVVEWLRLSGCCCTIMPVVSTVLSQLNNERTINLSTDLYSLIQPNSKHILFSCLFILRSKHMFQVIYHLNVSSWAWSPRQPTRCYPHAMTELLTTPTKAQCAAVNLPPPTRHLSPCYPAAPTSHLRLLYSNPKA